MLTSGNGRHRRPRQAPAAMVTVAATGAGLAIPLLCTGAAHAADVGTWDKVAMCETGGLWSADTGNGFYGGLAITQDTWDQYGGGVYAQRPDLASRSQQIAVAEKILADLGPHAWPGCEITTGLLRDTLVPKADPGDTATSVPAPPAPGASAPEYTVPAAPTPPAVPTTGGIPGLDLTVLPVTPTAPPVAGRPNHTPPTVAAPPAVPTTGGTPGAAPTAPPATPTDPAAGPTAPGQSTPGTGGRHAKPYDPTDEELAAADQATRTHAYSVTERDVLTESVNNADESGTSAPGAYAVHAGDSLSGIAAAQHVDGGWHRLYEVNHDVVGDDPNLIKPGQILNLG
ncbi:transglycosylase family protein [Streptomyces sp.]|uniref:transglycosylase family protein n=1 Tax=Streptomyces sp. TaxID=1931 RepID=UPI002F3EC688